jgi:predicted DNA binding CopG/RHH family protein
MKKLKEIPDFKSEDEEREFWSTHSSMDYIDWSKGQLISFPNLKPTTKAISIRLPEITIAKLKTKANKMDVPYQSLIKIYIEEGINGGKQINRPRGKHKAAGKHSKSKKIA